MIPPLSRSSREIRTVSVMLLELRVGVPEMTNAFVLLCAIQASVPSGLISNTTSPLLLTAAVAERSPLSSDMVSVLARLLALVPSLTTTLILCITVCSLDPSAVLVFIHSPVEMVMIARSDLPLVRTLSTARFWYLSSSWTSVICVGTVVIILSDTCIGVCSLPDTTQYASVIRSSNHIVTDDGAGLLNQIGAVSKAKYKSV